MQPQALNETKLYTPSPASTDAVHIGLAFPAPYSFAMSSLGYMTLLKELEIDPDINVTRLYSEDWSTYSNDIKTMDCLAYSFGFELDILEILKSMEELSIPFYANERDHNYPLLFAGGNTVMTNPEPFADFFDFFVIGEGEGLLSQVVKRLDELKHITDKTERLTQLAESTAGIYVPSLYDIQYHGKQDTIKSIAPKTDRIPAVVEKQMLTDMATTISASPILTKDTVFSNTYLVEVMRGCAHRCRFCLASYAMLPARGPNLDTLISTIEAGLQHTRKIGLLGALIAGHPQFDELCHYLNGYDGLSLSAASLRVDTMSPLIAETFKKGGQKQLTLAIESGSDKLKRRINKNITNEDVSKAVGIMAASGLQGVKLYGMSGLPDETMEDIDELADLMIRLRKENPGFKIHLGCSSFVPKAWTPFQWQPRLDTKSVDKRLKHLQKRLGGVCDFRPQSAKWDYFQAILSRGDRRLSPWIIQFYQLGSHLGSINRSMKELPEAVKNTIPDLDWYALRERPKDEILPWDMLFLSVSKEILYKEGLPPPPKREAVIQ